MVEYFNYNNVFLAENVIEILEPIRINDQTIKLDKSKQLFFSLIYSLEPVKLKILKTYIETNLANGFICSFKFFTKVPIFFYWKPNRSFCFSIDY